MLTLKNINKIYEIAWEQVQVLKNVSVEIKQWEFVAIMWPSGSWKSTLMNIIWLLDTPTTGSYELDWRQIEDLSWDEQSRFRGQKVWFIFQWYNLIPRLSVLEQVMLPLSYQWIEAHQRKEMAIIALQKVWLIEKINNKPNELSWWQQQRVAIARAIVWNPAIILADEPTWALDSKTWVEVMNIIKWLNAEWKTVILITHDAHIAEFADRVVKVKDGEIE